MLVVSEKKHPRYNILPTPSPAPSPTSRKQPSLLNLLIELRILRIQPLLILNLHLPLHSILINQ
jgi:hypothetical protein